MSSGWIGGVGIVVSMITFLAVSFFLNRLTSEQVMPTVDQLMAVTAKNSQVQFAASMLSRSR
jgi:hypothetical protein